MIIYNLREVKNKEFRVTVAVSGVHKMLAHGHRVLVKTGAGTGSGIPDEDYAAACAQLVADADELWARADMVMKVKEPVAAEYHRSRQGLMLLTRCDVRGRRCLNCW